MQYIQRNILLGLKLSIRNAIKCQATLKIRCRIIKLYFAAQFLFAGPVSSLHVS